MPVCLCTILCKYPPLCRWKQTGFPLRAYGKFASQAVSSRPTQCSSRQVLLTYTKMLTTFNNTVAKLNAVSLLFLKYKKQETSACGLNEQCAVQHTQSAMGFDIIYSAVRLIIKPHRLYKPSHYTGNQHDGRQPHQLAPGLAASFEYLETIHKDGFASAITGIRTD